MDYGMLQGAISSLKVAGDIAVALNGLKTMSEVQAKAIELQQIILTVQSSALTAQSDQFALLQTIRDLEAEVARIKAWDEEQQRYALVSPWQGAVIYALKRESSRSEPPHWICCTCYEAGRKSIVNDLTLTPAKGPHTLVLNCPACKSQTQSGWSGGSIERKYAEDVK